MKKKFFIITCIIVLSIIQIYLVSVQTINKLVDNAYDDALMIEQADSILKGKWLGEYNCLTLIKGPVTPLFMAVANVLNIPFLIAQDIFYIIACVLLISILGKLIKNDIVKVIIFGLLIFNPIIFSTELCRTYRDGIYTALIIYMITFTFGIYFNRKEKISKIIWYYIGLGFALGLIYLCREETIWILPYLVVSIVITIISIIKEKEIENKIKRILLYVIPILIVSLMTILVMIMNYKYYGVFQLNQYWGKEFKEAYGAFTRIIPEQKIKKVPVTSDMLEKAYKISPKCKELKEYFDKETVNWAKCGDGSLKEIQGGYFHWALIRAVESKGYYKDAKTANKFYQELADEINKACDEGKVNCLKNKRVSNVNRFGIEDLGKALLKCKDVIKYQYKMILVKVKVPINTLNVEENDEKINKLEEVTLTKNDDRNELYNGKNDEIRINILEQINKIYSKINPFIFYESIIVCIGFIIITIVEKRKRTEEIIMLIGLVGIYLCRIFIISFTSSTMYTSAINVMYLAPTYVIQMIFSILSNVFLGKEIVIYINERKNKWKQ